MTQALPLLAASRAHAYISVATHSLQSRPAFFPASMSMAAQSKSSSRTVVRKEGRIKCLVQVDLNSFLFNERAIVKC